MENDKTIEIILGNKNVAEAGSKQVNITQNNLDAAKVEELIRAMHSISDEGSVPQPPRKRRPKAARVVQDTFTYRWLSHAQGRTRLMKLYQHLTAEPLRWLDPATTPEQWEALFTGTPQSFTLKWLGTQMQLKHLFRLLLDRKYIIHDPTAGHWEILGSHFLDSKSKPFTTDWNRVSTPRRGLRVFDQLAEVLNILTVLTVDS